MSEYHVRLVDHADDDVREELMILHSLTFGTTAPMLTPGDDEEAYVWFAFQGETPVGYVMLVPAEGQKKIGYLTRIGVVTAHRRHGLARSLLRCAERKARALGWTGMVSETSANIPSANNFRKAGWEIFEPESRWSGLRETIYWRKALDPRT